MWLFSGSKDTLGDLFTAKSERFVSRFPMSPSALMFIQCARTAALPFRVVQLRYIRVRSTSFSSRARFPAVTSSFYLVFAKSRRQSEASWLKYFVMRAASIEIVATDFSRYNRESVVEKICVEF